MQKTLTIEAAESGGFIVTNYNIPGNRRDLLFAGSIDDCLAFMKRTLTGGDLVDYAKKGEIGPRA